MVFDAELAQDAGTRCNWLVKAQRLSLAAQAQERLAFLAMVSHDSIADRAEREVAAQVATRPVPCEGPDVESPTGPKVRTRLFAQSVTDTWALRARAHLEAMKALPFAAEMAPLEAHRAAIERAAQRASRLRADPAQFDAEAREVLALACDGRKNVRSASGPRACPTRPTPLTSAQVQYADYLLTALERFASVLTDAYREAAGTTSTYKMTSAMSLGGSGVLMSCGTGELVIRNPEAGLTDMPIYRMGDWEPVGRVSVGAFGSDEFALLSADADAAQAGASGLVLFKRC